MKLIVLSNPTLLDREVETIHLLFEAGMDRFHLRKPDWSFGKLKSFLHHIDSKYHSKISIHAHHKLIEEFNLGGLHFTESTRNELGKEVIKSMKSDRVKLSTSFHQLVEFSKWDGLFDYAFLSPVFDSISKQGYAGAFQGGFELSTSYVTKLIGLGGISGSNISQIYEMGFDGAAVLGTIWKQPHKAVSQFKELANRVSCDLMS